MAVNATLNLALDRTSGRFSVDEGSTRLYVYDAAIDLSVGGWTRDEVAIGQDGKTMYEPYFQIVCGGMVLAEAKLNGVENPEEGEDGYFMTGTLSTNTVQMAAMFCGCAASETMRQFEARIFSTTSANPIATGRVSVWSFPSGGSNPANLPSASEVLAALNEKVDAHVDNTDIHVTAEQKAAWTAKQDALTFDNAPTADSANPVKSGGVKTAIDSEATARASGDSTLQAAIDAEATTRQEEDNDLGIYIQNEEIRAKGAENLIQGDLNNHKGNTNIHVTADQKAAWTAKQDAIEDLSTIRTGAAAGATALQPSTVLDDGKIKASLLPSYVDDVVEYASLEGFPATGESGKIYVAQNTNKVYRWSGTQYVEISPAPDISGKADKVASATSGDLAGLDSSGNLTDSGVKPADFATRANIAGEFSTSTAYEQGALVWYNGTLYRCLAYKPAGAWISGYFSAATVNDVLERKILTEDAILYLRQWVLSGSLANGWRVSSFPSWKSASSRWQMSITNDDAGQMEDLYDSTHGSDATQLSFISSTEGRASITATKQYNYTQGDRLGAPLPTLGTVNGKAAKPSSSTAGHVATLTSGGDLQDGGVALSGLATKADATLTERTGFSGWTIAPSSITYDGQTYQSSYYKPQFGNIEGRGDEWFHQTPDYYETLNSTDPDATSFTYTFGGQSVTATRTALSGYQLGTQTEKPLASEAEAEALRQAVAAKYEKPTGGIPATDLASGVQTSLGKADTALQAHQQLAEVYGDPSSATWTYSDGGLPTGTSVALEYTTAGGTPHFIVVVSPEAWYIDHYEFPTETTQATFTFSLVEDGDEYTVTATRVPVSYQLGSQETRKLATAAQGALALTAVQPSALNAALPYSQTATTGDSSLALSTRSGNRYDFSAVTGTVSVTLPTIESGKCADVVCTIVTGATVPTLSFPSGLTFIPAVSDWQTLAASSYNVFSFTSTGASGEWIVGRITSALPTT